MAVDILASLDSEDSSTGGIFLLVVLFFTFLGLSLQVGFHMRRKYQPIRSRFPARAQLVAANCLLLSLAMAISSDVNYSNCNFGMSTALIFGLNTTAAAVLRAAHVVAAYETAQARKKQKEGSVRNLFVAGKFQANNSVRTFTIIPNKSHGFFVRHSLLIQNIRIQALYFIAACCVNATVFLLYVFLTNDCLSVVNTLITICTMGTLYGIGIIVLAFKMRPINDGLYLKQEMKALGYITLVSVSIWGMLNIFTVERFIGNAVITVAALLAHFFVISLPLFKTYSWEKLTEIDVGRKSSKTSMRTSTYGNNELTQLLSFDDGYDAFRDFLIQEFSSENLDFFENAEIFLADYQAEEDFDAREAAKDWYCS
mmetsp:Transcript_22878/g.28014  ORF Transcript_22878/g.28014 Transcript_22878/m.28014 type:complete len:369 (+) Transcript_22878:149-1255(+)